jgi:hypothetical protein
MDEQWKYAIPLSATILAARKLTEPGDKPSPALEACIANAISNVETLRMRIDDPLDG